MTDARKAALNRIIDGLEKVPEDQYPFLEGYVSAVVDLGLAKAEDEEEVEPSEDASGVDGDDLPFC